MPYGFPRCWWSAWKASVPPWPVPTARRWSTRSVIVSTSRCSKRATTCTARRSRPSWTWSTGGCGRPPGLGRAERALGDRAGGPQRGDLFRAEADARQHLVGVLAGRWRGPGGVGRRAAESGCRSGLRGPPEGKERAASAVVGMAGGLARTQDRGDASVGALEQVGPLGSGPCAERGGQSLAQVGPAIAVLRRRQVAMAQAEPVE